MADSLKPVQHHSNTLAVLEKVIAKSCECKLREFCPDKTSVDCLKHRNLYAEAMLSGSITK